MVVGGSVFPHRRIRKATRICPDHRSENQLDHVCIGQMFRWSLLDVRVYWGADVASDHHLVLARIKMKLKRVWVTRSTRPCYNVRFLKDGFWIGSAYLLTIGTKYSRTYWKMKARTCRTNGNSTKET